MVVGQFGSYIREMMDSFDRPLYSGDVILLNDPYLCGGAISHINDFLVLMPVFDNDELIGWCRCSDIRWMLVAPSPARSRLTPRRSSVKACVSHRSNCLRKGKLNEDVLNLILNNVRIPVMNRSDLMGIVAGCKTAEQRVLELCQRFGRDTYLAATRRCWIAPIAR